MTPCFIRLVRMLVTLGLVTPMACASASGETSVLCCARWWMASRYRRLESVSVMAFRSFNRQKGTQATNGPAPLFRHYCV